MKSKFFPLFMVCFAFFYACKKDASLLNYAIMPGTKTITVDSSLQLTDGVSGGLWASSDSSILKINSLGLAEGLKAGTAIISYTVGSIITYDTLTINAITVITPITGNNIISLSSISNTSQLNNPILGGSWSVADSTIATIDNSGLVTGIAPGTTIVSYSVNNGIYNFTATQAMVIVP